MDDALQPVMIYKSQPVASPFFAGMESFVRMNGTTIRRFSTDNTVFETALETDQPAGAYPITFAYSDNLRYGAIGRKIYLGYAETLYDETDNNTWRYQFTLPFAVTDSSTLYYEPEQSQIICRTPGDSLYYYSIYLNKGTRHHRTTDLMKDFGGAGIDTITITHGSRGCFHGYADNITYALSGALMLNLSAAGCEEQIIKKQRVGDRRISMSLCRNGSSNSFVIATTGCRYSQTSGFTPKDLEQCKRDILEFRDAAPDKSRLGSERFLFR